MGLKNKIENWILSKSSSYNFYKNQYEQNSLKNKTSNPAIENEFKELKKEFDSFKLLTDNQMDSMSYLMRTLLIDYEMNDSKNTLKNIHDLSNELLIFIANLCDNNNLNWWLDFTTLLGAVRHNYFIPWEDKIDISMPRKDFMEFKKIIPDEIEKHNLSDTVEIESSKEKSSLTLLIKNQRLNDSNLYLTLFNIYAYDFLHVYDKKTTKKAYKKCFDNNYNLEKYYSELNLSYEKKDYLILGINQKPYKFLIFKSEKVFPLKKVQFGEKLYNCPVNTHYYLKKLYRDYHNIPQEIAIPKTVDKFRYIDSDEIYRESINKLKEINLNLG